MQATTDRLHLKDALQLVTRVASSRSALPALRGVLLTSTTDTLELRATDLDRAAVLTIPASDTLPGTVLLDARALRKLVTSGADTVTIDGAGRVVNGPTVSTLRPMPAEDFPSLPFQSATDRAPVSVDALERVARACSTDVARPVLTGVLLDADGSAVATDSYRMFHAERVHGLTSAALVPGSVVRDLVRHLDGVTAGNGTDTVTFAGTLVKGGKRSPRRTTVVVVSNVIDGAYPAWRKLLPDPETVVATLDLAGIDTDVLRTWGKGRAPSQPVTVTANGDVRCSMSSRDGINGDARFPGGSSDGEEYVAAYNPAYLADALDVSDGTAAFRDGLKPLLLAGRVSALLMPMRVH